jgi:hypothetical protein
MVMAKIAAAMMRDGENYLSNIFIQKRVPILSLFTKRLGSTVVRATDS